MLLFLPAVLMVAGGAVLSSALAGSTPDQNRTCVDNPSGAISLNVDVVGVPGNPGPQGPQGEVGPGGARGEKGRRGAEGQRGTVGEPGPKGDEGQRGPIGSKGQKGSRGVEGLQGPQGIIGVEGVVGPRGYPGLDGPRGPVGPSGPQGIPGPQGESGDTVLSKQEFERIRQQVYSSLLAEMNATLESVKDDGARQVDQKVQLLMEADVRIDNKIRSFNNEIMKLDNKLQALKVVNTTLDNKLQNLSDILNSCCSERTMCGIYGPWKKVKAFNASKGEPCPSQFRTVTNQDNTTRACGRGTLTTTVTSCSSVSIPVSDEYSQVCGIVQGYQFGHTYAFSYSTNSVDSQYVNGIAITHGSPRRHLWTYANGRSELDGCLSCRCPCVKSNYNYTIPSFVGEDYYCESAFYNSARFAVAWEDQLWDGAGCHSDPLVNECCKSYGWFHRQVQPSRDPIEVRTCNFHNYNFADTLLESYEFWVM